MKKKNTNYIQILEKLSELHKSHPSYGFGRHIAMAFSEYKDIWGLSDKEALFALEKYEAELELDNDNIASPEYMEKLMKDVQNFENILEEDEEEEE